MTNAQTKEVAIRMIGFEYFSNCMKNGASAMEAKREMMSEKGQKEIAKRIKALKI